MWGDHISNHRSWLLEKDRQDIRIVVVQQRSISVVQSEETSRTELHKRTNIISVSIWRDNSALKGLDESVYMPIVSVGRIETQNYDLRSIQAAAAPFGWPRWTLFSATFSNHSEIWFTCEPFLSNDGTNITSRTPQMSEFKIMGGRFVLVVSHSGSTVERNNSNIINATSKDKLVVVPASLQV
jgi:hypothetical protein